MKVFVTGATGAIGPATVRVLLDAGHEVRAVARTDEKADALRRAGAEPVIVDLFDDPAIRAATAGCDAIAHLATNVPEVTRAGRRGAWAMHNRLRTDATRTLLGAARANAIGIFLKESITFVYPDRGDAWIDESVPTVTSGMLAPTLEGEDLVDQYTAVGGRGVVLRFGLFYGSTSRGTDESLRLARWRASSVAGPAGAYMSSIHTDDVATAVRAALDAPAGRYNVVDDEPLTRRAYLDAFARAFGLPHLRRTPAFLIRLGAGSAASAFVASQRVANAKFKETTGWSASQPNARVGWQAVADARHAAAGR